MRDQELTFPRELNLVVTLQDGRVLDGWMVRFEYGFECERVLVAAWEIEELFPQP